MAALSLDVTADVVKKDGSSLSIQVQERCDNVRSLPKAGEALYLNLVKRGVSRVIPLRDVKSIHVVGREIYSVNE